MKLTIELDEQGRLNVNGPIQNKIACLGMLEMAKTVVMDFNPADQPRIQAPSAEDVAAVKSPLAI